MNAFRFYSKVKRKPPKDFMYNIVFFGNSILTFVYRIDLRFSCGYGKIS